MTDINRISKKIENQIVKYNTPGGHLAIPLSSHIATWLLSCVPKDKIDKPFTTQEDLDNDPIYFIEQGKVIGWNDFRAELLRRISHDRY